MPIFSHKFDAAKMCPGDEPVRVIYLPLTVSRNASGMNVTCPINDAMRQLKAYTIEAQPIEENSFTSESKL